MKDGMSYVQLYYNKACTRELEKDQEGNYIFKMGNISNNAVTPSVVKIWIKNNGSHIAYEVQLEVISSTIPVVASSIIDKVYSMQITHLAISIDIPSNELNKHTIILRASYDSI